MRKWLLLTIGSTDVILHPALLMYLLYALLTGHGAFALLATGSILLHELSHAVCAVLFGYPPRSIELTPLGAVMRLEDEYRLPPLRRAVMVLAGPVATFLLCMAAVMLTKCQVLPQNVGRMLFLSNLSILLLNLLPALPLDGGRLLSVLLGMFLPVRRVQLVMRCVSTLLGLGMIVLNIYVSCTLGGWNLTLAFAGCCLLYGSAVSATTRAMEELRSFMDRKIALEQQGSQPVRCYVALGNVPLGKLVRNLPPGRQAMFLCVEVGSMKLLGFLTEAELTRQYLNRPDMTLQEAASLYPKCQFAPKSDTN